MPRRRGGWSPAVSAAAPTPDGPRPTDLIWTVEIRTAPPLILAIRSGSKGSGWFDPRSNPGRCIRIWRPRSVGGAGGGAGRRSSAPAAAGHWELAGLRHFSAPELKSERAWVREVVRVMAKPTGHTGKGMWVLQELTTVRGGGAEATRVVPTTLGSPGLQSCTGRRRVHLRSKNRSQFGTNCTGWVKSGRRERPYRT